MNMLIQIIFTLLIITVVFFGMIYLSIYISNKYPKSKITSFIKANIIDNYEGDDF